MIAKLKTNRVYRTYTGGSRIDALLEGRKTEDGRFPEDWLASTVRAFNPGREDIVEGLGQTEDGTPICDLAPQGLPILVKLLDAAQRLVIQAHPTRAFAWKGLGIPRWAKRNAGISWRRMRTPAFISAFRQESPRKNGWKSAKSRMCLPCWPACTDSR